MCFVVVLITCWGPPFVACPYPEFESVDGHPTKCGYSQRARTSRILVESVVDKSMEMTSSSLSWCRRRQGQRRREIRGCGLVERYGWLALFLGGGDILFVVALNFPNPVVSFLGGAYSCLVVREKNPLPRRVSPEGVPRPIVAQFADYGVVFPVSRFFFRGTAGMWQRASREPFLPDFLIAGFGVVACDFYCPRFR
jgi:hypothetical protein